MKSPSLLLATKHYWNAFLGGSAPSMLLHMMDWTPQTFARASHISSIMVSFSLSPHTCWGARMTLDSESLTHCWYRKFYFQKKFFPDSLYLRPKCPNCREILGKEKTRSSSYGEMEKWLNSEGIWTPFWQVPSIFPGFLPKHGFIPLLAGVYRAQWESFHGRSAGCRRPGLISGQIVWRRGEDSTSWCVPNSPLCN